MTGFLPVLLAQKESARLWTEQERHFLLDGLKSTQAELMKEVENLNEVQLAFKPDSTKWSIAEVLEHLGTFEEILHWDLFCNQYTPEEPGFTSNLTVKDSIMLAYATDTTKGKSPAVAVPLGRFTTLKELKQYFDYHRLEVIKLIENSTADFRKHYIYRPSEWGDWSVRDLHQYTIVYITHTTRHTNQIKKIKSAIHFPQNGKLWSETDRQYTLDNFKRVRGELIKETENLTTAQWNFKESPDRWSIAEIVEHLGIWERVWAREIDMATRNKPQPELNAKAKPDSYFNEWIMEEKAHDAPDFAKPTGLLEGKKNLTFFLLQNDLNIKYIETTPLDMRAYFEQNNREPRSLHHVLIFQWGHVDRHLRQIRKVKSHPKYPNK